MQELCDKIRQTFSLTGSAEKRDSAQRFFNEPIKCYGLASSEVKALAKKVGSATKGWPKDKVFSLCDELWKGGHLEEAGLACELSYGQRKHFVPADFETFETWVNTHVTNWANCDTLCTRTIGAFITAYPESVEKLKSMTSSPNRWTRRAAAVSLITPARNGLFLKDIFDIAEALLTDPDDMVQKGYGWMLKSASTPHPEEIFAYVMAKKNRMPRTALRYAIEKMPREWKQAAMAKE